MRILITGAKSEIAVACKKHLESKGHQVFVTSHSGVAGSFPFDLARPDQHEQDLQNILSQGLDAVILNAASETYRLASFDKIDFHEADRFLKENVQGNIWLMQKIIPKFKEQNFGRVIFISSGTTQFLVPGYSIYAAAKSAMESIVKYLAAELGEYNVTANTLRLGIFETERNRKFVGRSSIKEKMLSRISLKRLGAPKDLFLILETLLDKDSYLQGTVIDVNGGVSNPN